VWHKITILIIRFHAPIFERGRSFRKAMSWLNAIIVIPKSMLWSFKASEEDGIC
jgi:hypothetical protein